MYQSDEEREEVKRFRELERTHFSKLENRDEQFEAALNYLLGRYQPDWLSSGEGRFHTGAWQQVCSVANSVADYSKECNESLMNFRHRLHDAFYVLSTFVKAVNAPKGFFRPRELEIEPVREIWYHRDASEAYYEGYESEHACKFDVGELERSVWRYLIRPWMVNEELELKMVDALIFAALAEWGEYLKQETPAPRPSLAGAYKNAYWKAEGNFREMSRKRFWTRVMDRIAMLLATLLLLLALPVAIGGFLADSEQFSVKEVLFGMLVFGLGLVAVYRHRRRAARMNALRKHHEQNAWAWKKMNAQNEKLKRPPVNPTLLRREIDDCRSANGGILVSDELFAILDYAIARNPIVWASEELRKDGVRSVSVREASMVWRRGARD